jgi:hypothetical protein
MERGLAGGAVVAAVVVSLVCAISNVELSSNKSIIVIIFFTKVLGK